MSTVWRIPLTCCYTTLGENMVSVTGLTKSFPFSREQLKAKKLKKGTLVAANDVSFEVREGEIFALLGPNGAGKTTTLRCVAGLINPDAGQININGVDRIRRPFDARQQLCFLTSELKLDDHFTTDYLLTYYARLYGKTEDQIRRIKTELFTELGITEFQHVRIGKLSTGMKQKAMIALNLIHDPNVIIFDEPTNGLDVITARTVTDYILKLRGKGKTIILSTHIMEVAQRVSDRIAIMLEGKIVLSGTLSELYEATQTSNLDDAFFAAYRDLNGGILHE